MSLVVGLTGGIGSGKTTVAGLFAVHGAAIIDTDAIAQHLTQANGLAIVALRLTFGDEFIAENGAMNRAKMRQLVFRDVNAKQRLEKILHPLILEQSKVLLKRIHAKPYTILVVPLLAESPLFQQLVQRVLVVDCDENIQITRVINTRSMSQAEARAVISQQSSRTERLQLADDVIHNDAGLDKLAEQIAILHKQYLQST